MTSPPDDRSPLAVGLVWVSRITAISAVMVGPGLAGYWVDQQLNTKVVFTLFGFALGMSIGMWQLIRATGSDEQD